MKVFFPFWRPFKKQGVDETKVKFKFILFLRRLSFINKLKINVIPLLGLDPTTKKITAKFIETLKRKKL